jgi:hypothetical protein
MAERKTSKDTQRNGTLQSVRTAKAGSKKQPSKGTTRSGSLQSVRTSSDKKKTDASKKSKGITRGGK